MPEIWARPTVAARTAAPARTLALAALLALLAIANVAAAHVHADDSDVPCSLCAVGSDESGLVEGRFELPSECADCRSTTAVARPALAAPARPGLPRGPPLLR